MKHETRSKLKKVENKKQKDCALKDKKQMENKTEKKQMDKKQGNKCKWTIKHANEKRKEARGQ